MSYPMKRKWRSIITYESDEDVSPPKICKVSLKHQTSDKSELGSSATRKRACWKLIDGVIHNKSDNVDLENLTPKKALICAVPESVNSVAVVNKISDTHIQINKSDCKVNANSKSDYHNVKKLFQGSVVPTVSIITHLGAKAFDIEVLSKLSSNAVFRGMTVINRRQTESNLLFQMLVTRIKYAASSISSYFQRKLLFDTSVWGNITQAVWASWMTVVQLLTCELVDNDVLEDAVESVIMFCKCQVLETIPFFMNNRKDPQIIIKYKALYNNILNLAIFLNVLLTKKKLVSEAFVLLAMDIALLPFSECVSRNKQKISLHLVRNVLKSQPDSWEACIVKVCSAMFEPSNWENEEVYVYLESGCRVNKCSIVLLTVIQCSLDLQEMLHNIRAFIQSMNSHKDMQGQAPDIFENTFIKWETQETSWCFEYALQEANWMIMKFYSEIKANYLEKVNHRSGCFQMILRDLVTLMEDPEWPAADYLLIGLCNLMVDTLKEENNIAKPSFKFLLECFRKVVLNLTETFSFQLDPAKASTSAFQHHLKTDSMELLFEEKPAVEDTDTLLFLQAALFAYSAKQSKGNSRAEDACLFYLASWCTDRMTEQEKYSFVKNILVRQSSEVNWVKAVNFVNENNVGDVIKKITNLRRSSGIVNLLSQIVQLKGSKHIFVSKSVMNFVAELLESNSIFFGLEPFIQEILSLRRDQVRVEHCRSIVRCLTSYLLLYPEKIGYYYGSIKSFLADTSVTVRNAAVRLMKKIGLQFYTDPFVLKKCVQLLITGGYYADSAAQYFCKIIWLVPVKNNNKEELDKKVTMLVNMFALIEDDRYVQDVFHTLFRIETEKSERTVKMQRKASEQMVEALASRCLKRTSNPNFLTREYIISYKLLYLFAKITPGPLLSCCFQLWLSLPQHRQYGNIDVLVATSKAMETILPCIRNPSESYLASVELDSFFVSSTFNKETIVSGISNVVAAVNLGGNCDLLQNYVSCLYGNFRFLSKIGSAGKLYSKIIWKQIFGLGLIFKDFDLNGLNVDNGRMEVILLGFLDELLNFFFSSDIRLRQVALCAFGCICLRYHWFIADKKFRRVYLTILTSDEPAAILVQVVQNISHYLRLMLEYSLDGNNRQLRPCLTVDLEGVAVDEKDVKETAVDIAEFVLRTYFPAATQVYNHRDKTVRMAVCELLLVTEQHKILHDKDLLRWMICMACDPEESISLPLLKQLLFYDESRIYKSAFAGFSLSYDLYKTLARFSDPIRGYYINDGCPVSVNEPLNRIIMKARRNHANFVACIMKNFFTTAIPCVFQLLFIADQVVHFEYYKRRDVILVIIAINSWLSQNTESIIQLFRKIIRGKTVPALDVHQKVVSDFLRLFLLLDMKLRLHQLYAISKKEIEKTESCKAFKILIRSGSKSFFVSDKTYGMVVSRKILKKGFKPGICSEDCIEGTLSCCGRNFSSDSLKKLYVRFKSVRKKSDDL